MKKIFAVLLGLLATNPMGAVSLSFTKAYLGIGTSYALQTNSISIGSPISSSLFQFQSLNPADVLFSGNNVAGTLTYVENGVTKTINAAITRPVKTGNTYQGFYLVEVNPAGSSTVTGVAYFVILSGFESAFTNNSTVSSSSDPVDNALNAVLSIQQNTDSDGDGVSDAQESNDGTNPQDGCSYNAASVTLTRSAAWNALDCDGDGVTNGTEITNGTNPLSGCSYTAASVTLTRSTAWNNGDCDGDGVTNGTEITNATNPLDGCSYNAASVTLTRSSAWNALDCDGDGVTNGTEISNGTDPKDGCNYNAASVTLARSAAWNALDC
ncbi:MAG: hypothetical protein ACKOX0_05860, partial [Bacteroidota bacterium]